MNRAGPSVLELASTRCSKKQYHEMERQGHFIEKRVELIEGEIIPVVRISPQRCCTIGLTCRWLRQEFAETYIIISRMPISIIDESEPEPDVALIRGRIDDFKELPSGAALVIETGQPVTDFILQRKADLYARAGIADYWVLDVDGRRLIVHREPRDGKYQNIEILSDADSIAPSEKPDASIQIVDLLP